MATVDELRGTISMRGREPHLIRRKSKSSWSRPTPILNRPRNCGAVTSSKQRFQNSTRRSGRIVGHLGRPSWRPLPLIIGAVLLIWVYRAILETRRPV